MPKLLNSFSETEKTIFSISLLWWRWSALCAVIIGALMLLALLVSAMLGHIEFALMAAYFVAIATAIGLAAIALLIIVWLVLVLTIPKLDFSRWWVVAYIIILSWPLYFGPISWHEWALASPTILGFILPRFFVSKLLKVRSIKMN